MKQIQYKFFIKYLNPTIGLIILLMNILGIVGLNYMIPSNVSMWDYEGFSITSIVTLLIGIMILLYGLYNLNRNDDIKFEEEGMKIIDDEIYFPYEDVNHISTSRYETQFHTKKGNFTIVKMFVKNNKEIDNMLLEELKLKINKKGFSPNDFYLLALFSLILLGLICMPSIYNKKWKTYISERLPLKKIETTQIEGTITRKSTVTLFEDHKGEMISSVSLQGLEEYPEIYFHYDSFTLEEQIENIKNPNPEYTKKYNEKIKKFNGNYKKLQQLPQGTKVKIKIRTDDYEDMKKYLAIGDLNKSNEQYDYRGSVKFYELSLDEEIIVQKKGLK